MVSIPRNIYESENGYTLVETLVASAILLGVLIPATLFFGRVASDRRAQDLILAFQMAGEEMERTAAFEIYEDEEWIIKLNNRSWRIHREIDTHMGLIEIRVKVSRNNQVRPLVELKTLRVTR
jgi:type II secretory pathway pseudopilin PulG